MNNFAAGEWKCVCAWVYRGGWREVLPQPEIRALSTSPFCCASFSPTLESIPPAGAENSPRSRRWIIPDNPPPHSAHRSSTTQDSRVQSVTKTQASGAGWQFFLRFVERFRASQGAVRGGGPVPLYRRTLVALNSSKTISGLLSLSAQSPIELPQTYEALDGPAENR